MSISKLESRNHIPGISKLLTVLTALRAVLQKKLFNYDPYGFIQVSAAQAVFVAIGLFLINLLFELPHFARIALIVFTGMLVISSIPNYNQRVWNLAIFCVLCFIYGDILTVLQDYRCWTVLAVGVCIGGLFASSIRYPFLLPMIPYMQAITTLALVIPVSTHPPQFIQFTCSECLVLLLTLSIMCLFPRVYFLRIFLRALYLTLQEVEQVFQAMIQKKLNDNKPLFRNLMTTQAHARALGDHEHGFSVLKIAMYCMALYTAITAIINKTITLTDDQLLILARTTAIIHTAIADDKPINMAQLPEQDSHNQIYNILLNIMHVWNTLCVKI